MIEDLQPFAIAFLIGLFIGIERERSHPIGLQAMGVRTFTLLALLGTLAAWVNQPIISTLIMLFVFAAILLGYLRSSNLQREDVEIGLTTEFSAATVFCLGFITLKNPFLAAMLGGTVLFILLSRKRLHTFSRNQLKPEEVRAAAILLVLMLGVLPFLPNYPIDAWQLFNPRRFGILVFLIAIIQFGGYVAIRVLGERLGMILMGFFGGLVSSTAVFATLPKTVNERPELTRSAVAAATVATVATLVQFAVIIWIAAPDLLSAISWPLVAMAVTGMVAAYLTVRRDSKEPIVSEHLNPLDLKAVFNMALLIAGMMLAVGVASHYLGTGGVLIVTFLGGLFGLQGAVYAIATLYFNNTIGLPEVTLGLGLALLASFLSKFLLLWGFVRKRYQYPGYTTLFLSAMLLAGTITYFFL